MPMNGLVTEWIIWFLIRSVGIQDNEISAFALMEYYLRIWSLALVKTRPNAVLGERVFSSIPS